MELVQRLSCRRLGINAPSTRHQISALQYSVTGVTVLSDLGAHFVDFNPQHK
ncbi:hypothetical protein [Rhodococcus sp. UFZ-B548]|uniref:hypothetical protein n=1 Tax=Rhodococcus sp. UFZ-B548 TaxID=2742212 RepID=UPI0015F6AB46|nr:hypothetical protein [Rhodococcus sp. UFZ-B548]